MGTFPVTYNICSKNRVNVILALVVSQDYILGFGYNLELSEATVVRNMIMMMAKGKYVFH